MHTDPIRSKIFIDNKIIEQVNTFNYLGNLLSYDGGNDISKKLNFTKITGVIKINSNQKQYSL